MRFQAVITGLGWVSRRSMGHPGRIRILETNGRLPEIKRKDVLAQPYNPFGRMDAFSKLGFAAISFALEDAGITTGSKEKEIGLVASTSTGCIGTDILYWKTMLKNGPSPVLFAYTLDSCFLGEAAICFGLTGENYVINEKKNHGRSALFFALEALSMGQCETVVCGVCNSDIGFVENYFEQIVPGALFLVLEPVKEKSSMIVSAESPESIYDNDNHLINDIFDLVKKYRPDIGVIF